MLAPRCVGALLAGINARVYVETGIISYLTARPSRDLIVAGHQQLTHEWWQDRRPQFELFVSELVLRESRARRP